MRLIDADAIEYVSSENGCQDDYAYRYDINELPTIDAVPVVRCSTCVFRPKEQTHCFKLSRDTADDNYCSFGQKREDETDTYG